MAPWVVSCSAPGGGQWRDPRLHGPALGQRQHAPEQREGGCGPPGGGPASQSGRHTRRLRGGGVPGIARAGGGGGTPPDALQKGFFRAGGGAASSTEEGADLQGFTSSRAHMLLQEVYGDSPHHNGGTHLTGGVPHDAVWKICWRKLAVKSSRWYSTPPRKVGHQFASVLAA